MMSTEMIVFLIIILCLIYIISYFIFFRKYVEIEDKQQPHKTTVDSPIQNPLKLNNLPKFTAIKDPNMMIIEKPNQDDDNDDVVMNDEPSPVINNRIDENTTITENDESIPINPEKSSLNQWNNVVTDTSTTTNKPTSVNQLGNNLNKSTNINQDVLNNSKGILVAFVNMEKHKALYDNTPFKHSGLLTKIKTTGTLDDTELCIYNTELNKWYENSKILRHVVHQISISMAVDLDNNQVYNKSILVFIMKFIRQFTKKYKKIERPWGEDDFGFIDMMYLLMIFMISPGIEDYKRETCANVIIHMVVRLGFLFGHSIQKGLIIYTSTPYIVAKLLINSKLTRNELKLLHKLLAFKYSKIPEKGFHYDSSFSIMDTFNNETPNNKCIKQRRELLIIAAKDLLSINKTPNFIDSIHKLNKILIHPTIKLGIFGINTFNMKNMKLNSNTVYNVEQNNYGLGVMPLSKVLRFFTKTYCFAIRGMMENIKYLPSSQLSEIGQTIPRNEFYTMQMRKPLNYHEQYFKYPEFGCIVWDNGANELQSKENIMIENPKSFVTMFNGIGVFYQSYNLYDHKDLKLTYYAEEIIILTDKPNNQIFDFTIKILNLSSTKDLNYYSFNNEKSNENQNDVLKIPCNGKAKTFKTKLKINENILEIIEDTHEIQTDPFKYPISINDQMSIEKYDVKNEGYALVDIHTKKPLVYFNCNSESIKNTNFTYDSKTNQWLYK
uniref:Anc-1 protein n=1 Tax=Fopius arisanus TaxID=64838 RepID=A0A0C9RD34_9HYME